jgi:hypothetical protein
MRISSEMMGVFCYGGEGGKPEPAKPKPAEKPAEKGSEPSKAEPETKG